MTERCEICSSSENLTTVSVRPSQYSPRVFASCVCENCKKKYHTAYFRFFYATETVAQNMVREYNDRHRDGTEVLYT